MKEVCDKKMSFNDCELTILRAAIDTADERRGMKVANSPEIKRIIGIVETFLRVKSLICYGGTAINNILPKQDQFYNKNIEIPDYDFYSSNALNDAKELVDIYVKNGFEEVEAKAYNHETIQPYNHETIKQNNITSNQMINQSSQSSRVE